MLQLGTRDIGMPQRGLDRCRCARYTRLAHFNRESIRSKSVISHTTPTPAAQLQQRKHENRYAVQVTTPISFLDARGSTGGYNTYRLRCINYSPIVESMRYISSDLGQHFLSPRSPLSRSRRPISLLLPIYTSLPSCQIRQCGQ